jgi:hypothetical protein
MHAWLCPTYLGLGFGDSDRNIEMFSGCDHMAGWRDVQPAQDQLRSLDTDAVSRNV